MTDNLKAKIAQDKREQARPRFWSHGSLEKRGFRWWLHRGRDTFSIECSLFHAGLKMYGFSVDENDEAATLGLYLWPVLVWLSFSRWSSAREHTVTEIKINFADEIRFRISWRADDHHSPHRWGWSWSVSVLDKLLGSPVYRADPHPTEFIGEVKMPERGYACTGRIARDSWRRPRWFRRTVVRAHVKMNTGEQIPIPGKGENSWDCGEDANYSQTFPAKTIEEALAHVAADAMRTREKRGGPNWRPANMCTMCGQRFPNERALVEHKEKEIAHARSIGRPW